MTVKELRPVLFGPEGKFEVEISWMDEQYSITDPSTPVMEAFADYLVDCVSCPQPFQYTIFLKQEYVKAVTA